MKGAAGALTLALAACLDVGGPSPPPAIAYDLLKNGNRDIYRASLAGTDTLRLTADSADERQPTAAAGTLVFVSYRDGNGELYAMPAAGGTPRRLTTTAPNEADPALSPDGSQLTYTRDDGGLPRLWLANADGSGPLRVTDALDFPGAVDGSPTWAPDGNHLAFVSTTTGSARLYRLQLSDMVITPLLSDTAPDVEPAWSPDGGRIAFTSGANGGAQISVLDLATSSVTQLTQAPGTNGAAAWLPDGRLIYVASVNGTSRLRWLDPAHPGTLHDIDVGVGIPGHPTAIRP